VRLATGLTQTDLVQKLKRKITQQMMLKYEQGSVNIPASVVADIARALDCQPSTLFGKIHLSRNLEAFKREGKLLKAFRSIPTAEGQITVINTAKALAQLYSGDDNVTADLAD